MIKFLLMDHPSVYNVIFESPAIHNFRAVLFYQMAIKFLTKKRVRIVRGDQEKSQKTYVVITQKMNKLYPIMSICLTKRTKSRYDRNNEGHPCLS